MAQLYAIIKSFSTTMTIFKQLVDLYLAEQERQIQNEAQRKSEELAVITYASRKAIAARDDEMIAMAHRMRIKFITREK